MISVCPVQHSLVRDCDTLPSTSYLLHWREGKREGIGKRRWREGGREGGSEGESERGMEGRERRRERGSDGEGE